MHSDRFDRQVGFFGAEGQELIEAVSVAVVGLGGTGSHVAQQLAYLGVTKFALIDGDRVSGSNLNRLIGATSDDAQNKVWKVDVAARLISTLHPKANPGLIRETFISDAGFDAIIGADVVFGCVDHDAPRLVLNELCQAYERAYFDIGTGIDPENPTGFGGRVHCSVAGGRCIHCDSLLDQTEVDAAFSSDEKRSVDAAIYGVPRVDLRNSGPSVVFLNGLLASVCVSEFVVNLTGLRPAQPLLEYRGSFGSLSVRMDAPASNCYYCRGEQLRGAREKADVHRYIRDGWGTRLASQHVSDGLEHRSQKSR